MPFRGRAQFGQNYRRTLQYVSNYRNDFRRGNFRGMQNYIGQNFTGGYRGNYQNDDFGRGRCRSGERQYSNNFRRNDQSSSRRPRSGLRASTNWGRIRYIKYLSSKIIFAKDCPNSNTEKETVRTVYTKCLI